MSDEKHRELLEKRSVAFECELPESPEKVWRALTTSEIVSEWLAPTDLRPEAGAKFAVHDAAIGSDPVECEVLSVEPERSIVFGWRDADARRDGLDSTVTFEIAGTDSGGTRLSIVHEVEPDAVDNHLRLDLGDRAFDRLNIGDVECAMRVRRDLPAGKGAHNRGAELTRGSRNQHSLAVSHNRWIVLGQRC